MDTPFEPILKNALEDIESLKTSYCLGIETIGSYLAGKLPKGEQQKVEEHISSCLYCLNQMLELKELIHLQGQGIPIPSSLIKKLEALYPEREKAKKRTLKELIPIVIQRIADLFIFPVRQWRYITVSLVTASIVLFITLSILDQEHIKHIYGKPEFNLDSFVQVSSFDSTGKKLQDAEGVIIDPQGIVATNLHPLVGASLAQITLRDGKTYQTRRVWKDEANNMALMKIDAEASSVLPIVDLKQIHIGQRVLIITDPFKPRKGIEPATISGFRSHLGRHAEGEVQYIQLASFTAKFTKGALVDQEGRLIGLIITEEKAIGLAVPLKEVSTLIKNQQPIPIIELKNIGFSQEALNYYFKGILAKDARRYDEATEFFKKSIELNPNIEGSHLELGSIYYHKRLYDLEITEYKEVLRLNPRNTDGLFFLAEAYETKSLYDFAIKEYEKIIAIDPDDAEAYYNLGLAYLTIGRKDKALAIYPKLKKLDPGFAEKLKILSRIT